MKVCVTGGTGFIGKRLVVALLAQGHTVVVPTRNATDVHLSNKRLHFIKCNLIDPEEDLTRCVNGCEVVFNCAGEIRNANRMMDLHVNATQRLLETYVCYLNSNGRKGRWVQLSSVGAYGPAIPANKIRIVSESTQVAPVGEYEISKTKADQLIMSVAQAQRDALTYSILRPSNVCGPSMPNGALRQWASAIKKGVFIFIGPNDAISTYVHVDDVVDALTACAFDVRAANQIFNVSNDCFQMEIVQAMATVYNSRIPKFRIPERAARIISSFHMLFKGIPLTPSRVNALVARTRYPSDKIYSILGVKPMIDIPKAIKGIVN